MRARKVAYGQESGAQAKRCFEEKRGKYDPSAYGGQHTWEGNQKWLDDIAGRRVVLTDLPLRKENALRKRGPDGEMLPQYVSEASAPGYAGELSAYAREIADLIDRGYIAVRGEIVGEFKVFFMVPTGSLPADLVEILTSHRAVDRKRMRDWADGGKVSPEPGGESRVLQAFAAAGLPVEPALSGAATLKEVTEIRTRLAEREKSAAAAEGREAQKRQLQETREEDARRKGEVLDPELLKAWLVRELTEQGSTSKKFLPKSEVITGILLRARKAEWLARRCRSIN